MLIKANHQALAQRSSHELREPWLIFHCFQGFYVRSFTAKGYAYGVASDYDV